MEIPALLLQNMRLFLIEGIEHRFDRLGLFCRGEYTRLSVDMEYSPGISTNGNTCFVVTKYEVIPN
jgi:hypothetical protein